MNEAEVNVTVSDGSLVLKELKKPCQANLPQVIEALNHVKRSLNDYLTELIDGGLKEQVIVTDSSDSEEEIDCDNVSGFIKGMATVNDSNNWCEENKVNYLSQAKRPKK